MRHRPIGLGVQGLADAFMLMRLPFESPEARRLNADIFETLYFAACEASFDHILGRGQQSVCLGRSPQRASPQQARSACKLAAARQDSTASDILRNRKRLNAKPLRGVRQRSRGAFPEYVCSECMPRVLLQLTPLAPTQGLLRVGREAGRV